MNNILLPSLVIAGALSAPAMAQRIDADGPGSGARLHLDLAMDSWRQANGSNWRSRATRTSGNLEMLYGGMAEAPFRPELDQDWFQLARHFVHETYSMHLVESGTLVDHKVLMLPLGQINTTDKMSVQLRQEVNGVPVINGSINAIFTMGGELLALQNTGAMVPANTNTTPAVSAKSAERNATEWFSRAQAVDPERTEAAELAFTRTNGLVSLTWRVEVHGTDHRIATLYIINAQTGQLQGTENLVHHFDVGGTVMTNATQGTLPDTGTNPPTQVPLPLARVTSSAGTVFTDADGNFNYPGVNTALNVTVEYVGQFYDVRNNAGADHSVVTTAQPAQANMILLNPGPAGGVTGEANAYMGSHATREMIKAVNPGDNTSDFNIVANVNLASTCNAFYNGSSINFYPTGGGCVNTSYSTVVAHELGHWLNVLYGTGNGGDGIGEGNADVFAMYTFDAPVVGKNFFGPGSNIRTGTNNSQYCGDGNGGCYGGVHADGEPWMGAAWKVRRNLKTTHGVSMGGMVADNIFMGWMNGFNQTTIDSIIETQWLTLDDDDGNINNGTPNANDIDAGFREQGFPGINLLFTLAQLPDTQDDSNPFTVDATVSSLIGNTITSVTLSYRAGPGAFQMAAMANLGGDDWQGTIPAQAAPSFVEYYITATDNGGLTQSFPGANAPLNFILGQVTPVLVTDFEPTGNNGWTGGVGGDNATTGVWVHVNPRGTAAQPEDDHTTGAGIRAWVTGQGTVGGSLGENDVDGGTTTLLSPAFDGSGSTFLIASYWRWYSNNTGAAPNADTFVVGVSNDGGSTWTNVETIGPGGNESNGGWINHSVDLATIIAPTANMRLRFRASDLGSGSIVEAGIDDIEIIDISSGDPCPPPSSYCIGGLNSAGTTATITMAGSQFVSDNNVTLLVDQAPPDKFGLFFYGQSQGQVPFGDGFRCVTNSIFRLYPLAQTDGAGQLSRAIDLTNPPPSGGQITGGSVWNFQFWFRDAMGPGGTGFNLTDAVEVPFCN
ncbi:MAG: hypothetical protein ACI8QZ_003269 [Chlamydiales bacterium]|jgi:hypothetical protein